MIQNVKGKIFINSNDNEFNIKTIIYNETDLITRLLLFK